MALEPRGRWAEITLRAKPVRGMKHSCDTHRQEDYFLGKIEGSFQPHPIRKPVWEIERSLYQPFPLPPAVEARKLLYTPPAVENVFQPHLTRNAGNNSWKPYSPEAIELRG